MKSVLVGGVVYACGSATAELLADPAHSSSGLNPEREFDVTGHVPREPWWHCPTPW